MDRFWILNCWLYSFSLIENSSRWHIELKLAREPTPIPKLLCDLSSFKRVLDFSFFLIYSTLFERAGSCIELYYYLWVLFSDNIFEASFVFKRVICNSSPWLLHFQEGIWFSNFSDVILCASSIISVLSSFSYSFKIITSECFWFETYFTISLSYITTGY